MSADGSIASEGVGYFLSTVGPEPVLWCKSCDRSIHVDNKDVPGLVQELQALHRCGPVDGRWSS